MGGQFWRAARATALTCLVVLPIWLLVEFYCFEWRILCVQDFDAPAVQRFHGPPDRTVGVVLLVVLATTFLIPPWMRTRSPGLRHRLRRRSGATARIAFVLALLAAAATAVAVGIGKHRLMAWSRAAMADLHDEPFHGTRWTLAEATALDGFTLVAFAVHVGAVGLFWMALVLRRTGRART